VQFTYLLTNILPNMKHYKELIKERHLEMLAVVKQKVESNPALSEQDKQARVATIESEITKTDGELQTLRMQRSVAS